MKKLYPAVTIDLRKLRHNIDKTVEKCKENGISVTGVVKGINGLLPVVDLFEKSECSSIAFSRLEQIEEARNAGFIGPYMSLRVPMLSEVPSLVRLADISLNSEKKVLDAINQECERQHRKHSAILMADLGDLREGYWDQEEMVAVACYI